MLSQLDHILFPDRCEVLEVVPSQRYVYPIFKNGHSSFLALRKRNNLKLLINQQILKIHSIDVVIRDPKDRLVSGINTFIQFILRDNPYLDRSTVQWFAQNYLYLNRHYCSQFNWLLNLARYTTTDTKLNFLSMNDIGVITSGIDRKPAGIEIASKELTQQIQQIKNNEMYQRIDTVIFESIGQSMTFHQLLQQIKRVEPAAHEYVIGHAQKILKPCTVLD
jgi:hypothetical protein